MRGRTHACLGAVTALPLAALAAHGGRPELPLVVAGALGGLLVDVDHPWSTVGKLVPLRFLAIREPVSVGFARCGWRTPFGTLWHRGPVHSRIVGLLVALGFGVGLRMADSNFPATWKVGIPAFQVALLSLALLLGWLSHLEADRLSPSPMPLWWPISTHPIGPHRLVAHRVVLRGRLLELSLQIGCVLVVVSSLR